MSTLRNSELRTLRIPVYDTLDQGAAAYQVSIRYRSRNTRVIIKITILTPPPPPPPPTRMAAITQTVFSDACSSMKNIEFWYKFHLSLFLSVQLPITRQYLNQCWPDRWVKMGKLGTDEFPAHRPVTLSFDTFFDLRLNLWLSKKSLGW